MKKRIVLGDTHGHWEDIYTIVEGEQPDEVILLGDYCDSYSLSAEQIVKCWKMLTKMRSAFEKQHGKDTFIMLMGNHDWHYISPMEKYSGFNQKTQAAMYDRLKKAFDKKLLKIVHIDDINKIVYSHAGISTVWMKEWTLDDIHNINDANVNAFNFSHIRFDMYGDSEYQGPLWIRPSALTYHCWGEDDGWTQIVGHTRTRTGEPLAISSTEKKKYDISEDYSDCNIFVIDNMPFFYIVETIGDDGKLIKRSIEKFKDIDISFEQ